MEFGSVSVHKTKMRAKGGVGYSHRLVGRRKSIVVEIIIQESAQLIHAYFLGVGWLYLCETKSEVPDQYLVRFHHSLNIVGTVLGGPVYQETFYYIFCFGYVFLFQVQFPQYGLVIIIRLNLQVSLELLQS